MVGKTNAERQAAYRAKRAKVGHVQVTGYCHEAQRADVILALKRLADDPSLTVTLRSTVTGRAVKL